MESKTGLVVAHGLWRAAGRRLNLWVAGVTTAGAVAFQSWSLLALSSAGYVGLVAWEVSRRGFWRETLEEIRRRPVVLPEITELSDVVARQFVHRFAQARADLERVTRSHPAALPPRMSADLEGVRGLEEQAVLLIERLEGLSRYLSDKSPDAVRREIDRLQRCGDLAVGAALEAEYRHACAALGEELATLDDLFVARELLVARLETLAATVEMLPSQIVRLAVVAEKSRAEAELDGALLDPRAWLADVRTLRDGLAEPEARETPGTEGRRLSA